MTGYNIMDTLTAYPSVEAMIRSAYEAKGLAAGIDRVVVDEVDVRIASAVSGATVHWKAGGGATKLFLKSCVPGTQGARYNDLLGTFSTEVKFFTDLAPRMQRFQEERGVPAGRRLDAVVPTLVVAGSVDGNCYIVLEDFVAQGYEVTGKEDFHSTEQVRLALEQVAAFHATAHCMGVRPEGGSDAKEFLVYSVTQHEQLMRDFSGTPTANNMKLVRLALEARQRDLKSPALDGLAVPEGVDTALVDAVIGYTAQWPRVFQRVRDPARADPSVRGVCHGDFHMWNMAFKKEKDGDMKVKFFDYQLVNLAPFAVDIHHYFSQVTTAAERDEHLDAWLGAYHDAYAGFYRLLSGGAAPADFDLDKLREEYRLRSPIALVFGYAFVMPRFVTDQDAEKIALDEARPLEERLEALARAGDKIAHALQIYVDNLKHYGDLGTYKVIEDLINKD